MPSKWAWSRCHISRSATLSGHHGPGKSAAGRVADYTCNDAPLAECPASMPRLLFKEGGGADCRPDQQFTIQLHNRTKKEEAKPRRAMFQLGDMHLQRVCVQCRRRVGGPTNVLKTLDEAHTIPPHTHTHTASFGSRGRFRKEERALQRTGLPGGGGNTMLREW